MKFEVGKTYKIKHGDEQADVEVLKVSGGRYHLSNGLKLIKVDMIAAVEAAGGSLALIQQEQEEEKEESTESKPKKKVTTTDITRLRISTPQEVKDYKAEWCAQELDRYNKDYQPKIKERVQGVEIGAMYYYGSGSYREFDVYAVDNIIKREFRDKRRRPKKGEKEEFEYICVVRVWDWHDKTWGGIPHKMEEYAHEISLEEFAKEARFPKLTKHPLDLLKEAEDALATGDVSKYELDSSERREADGPDTQVMHLGSKEALEAVQQDLEMRRNHAEIIKDTMKMIIEQKKRELEAVRDKLSGAIALFEKKIKKIFRVITTLELYLGIDEEIVQILEGPTAPAEDPICIRQAIMFMDEEFGDPWDDGQGLEWKDLSTFGDWLVRNGNYKKVLPESKCIAAFKVRRQEKERTGNPYWVARMAEMDNWTFLVMRNGDNIYRLITDKIEFRPRLFPKRKELQQLFELWKYADEAEEKQREKDRKEREKKMIEGMKFQKPGEEKEVEEEDNADYSDTYISFGDYHSRDEKIQKKFGETDFRGSSHSKSGEVKEYAEDHVFFYKMRFTLFQGIIERTQIFQPMKEIVRLFDKSAMEKGLVRLIYDDELTLPSGRPTFWQWMKNMNDQIDFGSRIVLSHNWGFISAFIKDDGDPGQDAYYARKERGNRLDDRYGDGTNFSNLPKDPDPGLYYVKKGARFEWVPVMIDNPFWREDLFTTPDETEYCPEEDVDKKPKDLKKYLGMKTNKRDYGDHVRHSVWMSYEDQIKYFGKIVRDERGFPFQQEEGSHVYNVFKNPKRIQKYEWEPVLTWKDGRQVSTGKKRPKYIKENVKVNFLCVRYNPKDKIERQGWTWKWDAEERKMNLSWKITKDDGFIINYDLVTVEDIDFYLNSRVDRRHYMHMMPLLWEVRTQLLKEEAEEADFKTLVKGEVLKASGRMPSDREVDQACEDWKKNLKWKRAIAHDDEKALRMIVKRLTK